MKLNIEIENINERDAIALESLLAMMENLGDLGGSRWLCFYSDGDGAFRPRIKVNGKKAELTPLLNHRELWRGDNYMIDSEFLPDLNKLEN